jgi:hypothetical protein
MTYVHRLAQFSLAMAALGFTRPRADPAQNPRKEIGGSVDFIGAPVSLLEKSPNIGGHIRGSRTGALTRDIDVHVKEIFRAGGIVDLLVHDDLAVPVRTTCK